MVRWNRSWLSAVIWSEIRRSRSLKRSANRSRESVVSSAMPVVPVQRVVSSTVVVPGPPRIVELRLARPDHDVVVVALAEVDPGLGDLGHARLRDRRQVLDPEAGLALGRDLVHRDHGHADAVRVDDALVHPAGRLGVLLDRQLAAREHDLAQRAVDHVAIRVDVHEVVVLANRLELVQRHPERAVVPQARVLEGVDLEAEGCLGERGRARVVPVRPLVEAEGLARHRDVVRDVAAPPGRTGWDRP